MDILDERVMKLARVAVSGTKDELRKYILELSKEEEEKGNKEFAKSLNMLTGNTSIVSLGSKEKSFLVVRNEFNFVKHSNQEFWHNDKRFTYIYDFLKYKKNLDLIKVFNCFIYGRPGTGKTTFVEELSNKLNKNVLNISAASLVSSKLGETQKNIKKLQIDIENNYHDSIFLIDEIDSIIGNRDLEINDEYKRMIGSFNIFLDSLPKRTILFGISNKINFIDKATLRRFNVKIGIDEIDEEQFKKSLKNEIEKVGSTFDDVLVEKFLRLLCKNLSYSNIQEFVSNSLIFNKSLNKVFLDFYEQLYGVQKYDDLKNLGFTIKEISNLKDVSFSTVQRALKGNL